VGSGAIDAGMNTWFAMRFGPRPMNWLHAFFGFGAMMGPIFLGAILSSGYSWRLGYGLMAVLQIAMALLVLLTARSWAIPASLGESSEPGQVTAQTTMLKTMLVPAVWLGVAVFFFYTGVELTAANWSFTIFTESRGVSLGTAGRWVSLFWFSFTVGRVLFGIIGNRVPVSNLLRGCMLAAVAGAALLAWSPGDSQGLWGLILIGVAVAPIFPLLVSETPLRLGQGLAQHAIGLQMAGASMGIAVIPSLAGVIASRTNLEAIPVFIVAVAAVLFLLHEWMVRATPEGLADHS
jgi:fucose permease